MGTAPWLQARAAGRLKKEFTETGKRGGRGIRFLLDKRRLSSWVDGRI